MIKWYHAFGIGSAVTLMILVIITIYLPASYSPVGLACVYTNYYGEHWIEFLIILASFPLFLHFIWITAKSEKMKEDNNGKVMEKIPTEKNEHIAGKGNVSVSDEGIFWEWKFENDKKDKNEN